MGNWAWGIGHGELGMGHGGNEFLRRLTDTNGLGCLTKNFKGGTSPRIDPWGQSKISNLKSKID